jgi:enoyl-CoA hydratase/carnithine racemase
MIVASPNPALFCAGADIRAFTQLDEQGGRGMLDAAHALFRAWEQSPIMTIAAVNGIAVGGGAEVTLCCDARLGGPAAGFYLPENTLGLTISNASSLLLPRLVGHRATRLVLESPRLDAPAALEMGLLDEIVDDPVASAIGLVHRWTGPGTATAAHLGLLRPPLDLVEDAFVRETAAARSVDESGIAKAGVDRFHAAR